MPGEKYAEEETEESLKSCQEMPFFPPPRKVGGQNEQNNLQELKIMRKQNENIISIEIV